MTSSSRLRSHRISSRFETSGTEHKAGPKFNGVLDLETGATGLPYPNETWHGYMSPDNAYTLDKLQALNPTRKGTAIMAQREKFNEKTSVHARIVAKEDPFTKQQVKAVQGKFARHGKDGLVQYEKGKFVRKDGELVKLNDVKGPNYLGIRDTSEKAPVHEFVLGRNLITASYAKAREAHVGGRKEDIAEDTINRFGSILEHFAKKDGDNTYGVHYSTFKLGDKANTTAVFSWTDEADRLPDLLMERTELGSLILINNSSDGQQHKQYTLFDDENGRSLDRQVWMQDPTFVMPEIPPTHEGLAGQDLTVYDQLLAGVIETTHRMEKASEMGFTVVDNIEANGTIGYISANLDEGPA